MMTKIKFAIAFIFGAIYYWAISYFIPYIQLSDNATFLGVVSGLIVISGGVSIILGVIIFFVENWDEP